VTTVVAVLVETHGKQEFLFSTGKRRESVGASQLVADVPRWALGEIADQTDQADRTDRAGSIAEGAEVEILLRTSGTFLAFCRSAHTARELVTSVTTRALIEAPGLAVTGVVGEPFEWDSGAAPASVRAVFAEMANVRVGVPSTATRFPVLPVTALCPSSALPAAELVSMGAGTELRSAVSAAKWRAAERAYVRLAADSGLSKANVRDAIRRLDGDDPQSPERVAVVHADGNGLGALIANLGRLLVDDGDPKPDTTYAARYREFSETLDTASKDAFRDAVGRLAATTGRKPDVLPLVLGGDDLTFVADAAVAPELTRHFLTTFVEYAATRDGVAGPVRQQTGDPRLGIAAGIAIVPPHFPFAAAYRLAEELLSDVAKSAKTRLVDVHDRPVPSVSLAVHVHIDSTASTVGQLQADLAVPGGLLTAAPYVHQVRPDDQPVDRVLSGPAEAWLAGRGLDQLWSLAAALVERDANGRRVRPSAQLHELRARLRLGRTTAQEYFRRLRSADANRWAALDPLFTERDGGPATTMLLDAMALAPFLDLAGAATAHDEPESSHA